MGILTKVPHVSMVGISAGEILGSRRHCRQKFEFGSGMLFSACRKQHSWPKIQIFVCNVVCFQESHQLKSQPYWHVELYPWYPRNLLTKVKFDPVFILSLAWIFACDLLKFTTGILMWLVGLKPKVNAFVCEWSYNFCLWLCLTTITASIDFKGWPFPDF